MHTACLTPDGVLLRLVIDGQTVAEARAMLYAPHMNFLRFRLVMSQLWRPAEASVWLFRLRENGVSDSRPFDRLPIP